MENEFNFEEEQGSSFNLKNELYKYLSKWYWIVLSIGIFYYLGKTYLKYQTPVYSASAKILIKGIEGSSSKKSSIQGFDKFLSNPTESIENQIEIFKSAKIIEKVIKNLNLNIIIKSKGQFRDGDIYKNAPITIKIDTLNSNSQDFTETFLIKEVSLNSYQKLNLDETVIGTYKYGEKVKIGNTFYEIRKNLNNNYETLVISLNSPQNSIGSYAGRLSVEPVGEDTAVLQLSFSDTDVERAKDFLNELLVQYDLDVLSDMDKSAKATNDFIIERLDILADELNLVEKDQENFKVKNELVDIGVSAGLYYGNKNDYTKRIIEGETQMKLVELVESQMNKSGRELIPLTMIPYDNSSTSLISQYNQLILEKNKYLDNSSTKNNPIIENLNEKINSIKKNLNE